MPLSWQNSDTNTHKLKRSPNLSLSHPQGRTRNPQGEKPKTSHLAHLRDSNESLMSPNVTGLAFWGTLCLKATLPKGKERNRGKTKCLWDQAGTLNSRRSLTKDWGKQTYVFSFSQRHVWPSSTDCCHASIPGQHCQNFPFWEKPEIHIFMCYHRTFKYCNLEKI